MLNITRTSRTSQCRISTSLPHIYRPQFHSCSINHAPHFSSTLFQSWQTLGTLNSILPSQGTGETRASLPVAFFNLSKTKCGFPFSNTPKDFRNASSPMTSKLKNWNKSVALRTLPLELQDADQIHPQYALNEALKSVRLSRISWETWKFLAMNSTFVTEPLFPNLAPFLMQRVSLYQCHRDYGKE